MIPSLKPYLYLGGIVAICLGVGYVYTLPEKYRDQGSREIEAIYQEESRIAMIERKAEIERLKHEQSEINRKVVTQYETQLKSLSDRLADAKRVGLHVPKTICSGIAATPEATSTEGNNGGETIRLPERIESGLFGLAEKCEQVQIERNSLIDWITQNGFYSSGQTSIPNKTN